MRLLDTVFSEDIVLDEEAFATAVADFSDLSQKLQNLRAEVEEMINDLKQGFNTPAGRKFIDSCEKNLFRPLDAQKIVIEHISETLNESKSAYESVFREYEALQNMINSVNK